MKNNKMTRKTKDEKRRLAFKKRNVKREQNLAQYNAKGGSALVIAKSFDFNRRFVAAFLALTFAISCLVVGFNFAIKAEDGKDYERAVEITLTSGKYVVDQAGIDAGLSAGTLCKYKDANGKYYAFSVPTDHDIRIGDQFILDTSVTPSKMNIVHDPRIAVGDESLEKLTNHLQDNNNGTFTINSTNENHSLNADTTYWYLDPNDNKTVYKFTPSKDYGYKEIELREESEVISGNSGTLTLTLDTDNEAMVLDGVQWYRHAIYEKTNTLTGNNVYLLVGVENGRRYMLFYDDSTYWQSQFKDQDVIAGDSHCSAAQGGENVYNLYYSDETNYLIASSASTESDTSKQVLYDGIGDSTPTVHRNYFDGFDGTVYKGDNDEIYDPYVYAELSSYYKKIGHWYTLGSGFPLMAYDGNTGYYTSSKAFGSYASMSREPQSRMFIKYLCNGRTTIIDHFQGHIWTYSNGKLYNNNLLAGAYAGFRYLNFSTTQTKIVDNWIGDDVYAPAGFFGYNESSSNEIELYQMKNVYDKEIIDDTYNLTVDTIKTSSVDVIPLENATVILNYDGADNASREFRVNVSLKDESGYSVTGTYPGTLYGSSHDFIFSEGTCTETLSLKDAQSAVITNIPYDYKIAVSTVEEDLDNTNTTIKEKDVESTAAGTTISSGEFITLSTDKQIDIDVVRDTTFKLQIIAPDNVADAYAEFCGYYNVLYDSGRTETSAYFKGNYGGDITFVGDNQTFPQISDEQQYVFGIPTVSNIEPYSGYGTPITVDNIRIFTRVVAAFQQGVDPSKYTVSSTLNDTLPLYTPKEAYSSTNQGWRTNDTSGTDQLLNLKDDNVIKIIYKGIDQNVTITHKVDGSSADKAEAVDMPLKLTLLSSENGVGIPLTITDTSGNTYIFGDDGVCTESIALSDNESKTFVIPYGYYLKVEDAEDYSEKYSTAFQDNTSAAKNIIKVDEGNSVTVTHKRNAHDVTITEKTSGTLANLSREFPFDLTLQKDGEGITIDISLTGNVTGTLSFTDGVLDDASKQLLKLAHDQSITLVGVPSGSTLTVSPVPAEYYTDTVTNTTSSAGSSAIIDDDNIGFTITRQREDAVDTGMSDNGKSSTLLLGILLSVTIASIVIFVVYDYGRRKKVT